MSVHLFKEIETLKKKLLTLGLLVSKTLHLAIQSVENRDQDLATKIELDDDLVDQMEVEIEEDCLKILALYQPVAVDLRFVITVLKINNDLERIADLAVNIAKKGKHISRAENFVMPIDFHGLSKIVEKMLDESIACLVQMDVNTAKNICLSDSQVDQIHKSSYDFVKKAILSDPQNYDSYNNCLSISRHLERIGDQATNIAEDVCYMVVGKIIRHKSIDLLNDLQS